MLHPECNNVEYLEYHTSKISGEIIAYGYQQVSGTAYIWIKKGGQAMTEKLTQLKERNITYSIQSTGRENKFLLCFHHSMKPGGCLLFDTHVLEEGIKWLQEMADKYFPEEEDKP